LRAHVPTGNAGPVLQEIATALARLLDTGQITTIDLGALPFSAGDEKALEAALGSGEVRATIDALGASHVHETGIPGVWRIDHFDQQGETLSRFVEITFVPEILKTQAPDAEQGLSRLQAELAARDGS
jgi:hydrogenase-1 operon protein HyaF